MATLTDDDGFTKSQRSFPKEFSYQFQILVRLASGRNQTTESPGKRMTLLTHILTWPSLSPPGIDTTPVSTAVCIAFGLGSDFLSIIEIA